jgi:hypothetical protein
MAPIIATMPALPLIANYTVEWVAIDPATGDDVSGVTITNPTLYGIDLSGNVGVTSNVPDVSPVWLPVPDNLFAPKP